jgi:putative ABC transport system permease protein
MLGYYLSLAVRGLRRNAVLTILAIGVIGVGVGGLMTVFTVIRTMSVDPIPAKSSRLFAVEIDNWGPNGSSDPLTHDQLSYTDAMALMRARRGRMQTAMYAVVFAIPPPASGARPFEATGRAVYADFFDMFDAPFRSGGPWSISDDRDGGKVVVLGARAADELFPRGDAVGRTVELNRHAYRVVGVLRPWHLEPRFYDLTPRLYQQTEDVFLPFTTAMAQRIGSEGTIDCDRPPASGLVTSECRWLQFWVELDTAQAVAAYRNFLHGYAAQQEDIGRFGWAPQVGLYDVDQWLANEDMVPEALRVSLAVSLGFLVVCLVNVVSLMLTKFRSRASELVVRRALGASRAHVFSQCLTEAVVIGAAGGTLGVLLTSLGVALERRILRDDYVQFAHLNGGLVATTVALAMCAMIGTSLYPAWRAGRSEPDWRLQSP